MCGGWVGRRAADSRGKVWSAWSDQQGFVEGRGGWGSSPRHSRCCVLLGPRRYWVLEAGLRAATVCDGVVDGDGRVGVGVLYSRVGPVADSLTGLGQVTRHGCSVACWKRKATQG